MMHKCPRCGYEPLPTPTCEPVVKKDHFFGKWQVMVWTEESEHRWVGEYSEEDANLIAGLLSEKLRMRGIEEEDD
jgi:hypothetical protein